MAEKPGGEPHRHGKAESLPGFFSMSSKLRILRQGESAHIPMNIAHGTYNTGDETLAFSAILSPAKIEGPPLVDMYGEEPWNSLRSSREAS